jgi:Icc protein
MKAAFITDLHVDTPYSLVENVDVCKNFENALKSAVSHNVSVVIIGGDLAYRIPNHETYSYIRSKLDETNLPYYITAGNHDSPEHIKEIFEINTFNFVINIEDYSLLFFDTSSGELAVENFDLMKSNIINRPVAVMHHPPIHCGVPHMDSKHSLKNIDEVSAKLKELNINTVFCGHFHIDKICIKDELTVIITPSTFFQISDEEETFSEPVTASGYRIIEFLPGTICTKVVWL